MSVYIPLPDADLAEARRIDEARRAAAKAEREAFAARPVPPAKTLAELEGELREAVEDLAFLRWEQTHGELAGQLASNRRFHALLADMAERERRLQHAVTAEKRRIEKAARKEAADPAVALAAAEERRRRHEALLLSVL